MAKKRQERGQELGGGLHNDLRAFMKWHSVAIASVNARMTNVQSAHYVRLLQEKVEIKAWFE